MSSSPCMKLADWQLERQVTHFPHLPHPLHTPAGCQDAVLRWFEEYASRLEAGWYGVEPQAESLGLGVGLCKGICLFPKMAPQMVTAVTRGVQVRL